MGDGGGLYLLVNPDGSKYWRMKYYYPGICKKTGEPKKLEKLLALGTYPLVSLADVREERNKAKKMLAKNIDPLKAKNEEQKKIIRNAKNSFKAVAIEWHENKKGCWNENHANNVLHRLERDVFPYIANMPISGIEAPDLLEVLRKIEKRGALDIAGRTRQICGQIFRHRKQLIQIKLRAISQIAKVNDVE